MKILFLHGWHSVPGGVKPTFLARHGHDVLNPALPDEDLEEAERIAQQEFDAHRPDVIVGSSRGGAVAMSIDSGDTPLVLLCPAWKRWGTSRAVKRNATILHSRADDVIPFEESEELVRISGLPSSALVEVGSDHRLADPDSLMRMLEACEGGSIHMISGDLRYLESPFECRQMNLWTEAIKRAYPSYHGEDAALNMMIGTLEQEAMFTTHFHFILCFEGELPVGLLKYVFADDGRRIELHHFAVRPSHQRRGIGSSLLEKIKAKASGWASVFASGINEPAHVPLQRAGFWKVKRRRGERAYKWSDQPDQQNDDTPEADEDQDE